MEATICDLCGSAEHEFLFSQKDIINKTAAGQYNMVRCKNCGLCYINPRPTTEEIIGCYPKEEYSFWGRQDILKCKALLILRSLINFAYVSDSLLPLKLMARFILFPLKLTYRGRKIITRNIMPKAKSYLDIKNRGRILDIGCGSGENIHIFGERESISNLGRMGWQVYGVEPSDKARSIVTERYGINCYPDLFEASFKDGFFDIIRMNWSLEHCHMPTEYLKECKRILSDKGKLLINIPNYQGITYKIFPNCVEVPVHLYHFTVPVFKKYCEKIAFKIMDYYTFSYLILFLRAFQLMGYDSFYERVLKNPTEAIRLQAFLNLMSSMDFGDDMIFCLTKS